MSVFGRFVLGCLSISAVLHSGVCSTEFGGPHVEHLTTSNFKEKTADGSLWMIKFFAPWCGHCKRLAGTWKDLGEAFKDRADVNIAHVDCTQDKEICTEAEVKGYPTLKLFFGGEDKKTYKGQRDVTAFKKFIEEQYAVLMTETTS